MSTSSPAVSVLFVVAAALIDDQGRILLQQRPPGLTMAGLWEFPGGKVERGESPENALVRELREELGIGVEAAVLTPLSFASEALGNRHLVLLLYAIREWTGEPTALHAAELSWVVPSAMTQLPMPPADRPLVQQLELYLAAEPSGP
jgi:8-oxo-dGTP diphosphatase